MALRFDRFPSFATALVLTFGVTVAATRGAADPDRTATVSVAGVDGELGGALRFALEEELGHVAGVRVVPEARASYRLRASVRSLDTTAQGANERVACVVSVVVEDRRTGAMRAILEGRARSEGPRGSVERETLVRAAVHGALRPIATTLAGR